MENKTVSVSQKFDLVEVFVLSFYYLLTVFLFLGLFGFFNRLAVYLTLAVLVLIILWLRRWIIFSKKCLWFFILTPLAVIGFGLLRGFFTGDAYSQWLPIGRDTLLTGHIPGFTAGYYYSGMPLLSLLFSATFAVFNSFNEFFCLWIPLFFTGATLYLIYQWLREKNLSKKFLFFVPLLFFSNSLVAFYGWNLLQESLVLFFSTAFFYFYEKYLAEKNQRYLIFLILALILAGLSKLSGLFLFILVPFIFFKAEHKKEFFSYLFLFSLPLIFWLARNYLIFDNPLFPLLNGFFKGRYYQLVQNYDSFIVLPSYLISFWSQFKSALKDFWFAFPFIFLCLYEFLKQKRYDYLSLVIGYFLIKEIFLFTPTISNIRYYYLFLGLILVYSFLGLERLKSRKGLVFLTTLALTGLFLAPLTNSSSQFISSFENRFSFLGDLFSFLHNYWYLVLLILVPFIYQTAKNKEFKIFLIFSYALYILHLNFVANKSWLNTWSFIGLALIFLFLFIWEKEDGFFRPIAALLIILVILVNSWLLAMIYYWRQEKIIWPPAQIWQESQWSKQILDRIVPIEQRKDFYLLVASQPGYYKWWSDYQAFAFLGYDFWFFFSEYKSGSSADQLHQLMVKKRVKYLVKNLSETDLTQIEFEKFFSKIEKSDQFKLIANKNNKYFIWQVY